MKHKREWLGLLAICVLLAGVVGGTAAYSILLPPPEPPKVVEVGIGLPGIDSIYRSPLERYEHCDLVVRGVYQGEDKGKPYPAGGDGTFPTAYGRLAVNEVLKGECDDIINFYYNGGEIYAKEAIETAEREGVDREKFNIFPDLDSTDPEANVIYRAEKGNEYFFEPVVGKEYILYLNYEEKLFQGYCLQHVGPAVRQWTASGT